MATFVKTPSGWKAVVRKQGWPTTSKTFRAKRDAEDWARRTEDEMVRGVYIQRAPAERMTLKAALDRYLSEVTPLKAPGTQAGEKTNAAVLDKELGAYSLAAVTPELVSKYRDKRLATVSEKTGRLISNNTVRLELALLGNLYNVAIKEWGIGLPYNPVANIRKPSPGEGRNRRLTWSELKRLLRACDNHSNPFLGQIVRIALYTAMRQGEILSLTRRQVDLARRVVRLENSKNGEARTVPLSRRAVKVFREALANPIRPIDCELIFFGEPGNEKDGQGRPKKKRGPYCVNGVWRKAVEKAGVQDFRFHDLRHEATSRLVEMGLSDQEVAAITGHKTMQMLRRYTHLRAEDLVEKLDRRVGMRR